MFKHFDKWDYGSTKFTPKVGKIFNFIFLDLGKTGRWKGEGVRLDIVDETVNTK